MKIDILSLKPEELEREILAMGEKKFRAKQLFEWLHKKKITDFSECSNLSAALIAKLGEKFEIKRLTVKKRLISAIDDTVKYLY